MNTSVWRDMWGLVRYARSGGVDQVCEHGSLQKGLGIVGLTFVVRVIVTLLVWSSTAVLMGVFIPTATFTQYIGDFITSYAYPAISALVVWGYMRLLSNPNLTYTRTLTIVMYTFTYTLVFEIIAGIIAIIGLWVSYYGLYSLASIISMLGSLLLILWALYIILCCIHLFRKGLNTTLVHTIMSCIVTFMVYVIIAYVLGGFNGAFTGLPNL